MRLNRSAVPFSIRLSVCVGFIYGYSHCRHAISESITENTLEQDSDARDRSDKSETFFLGRVFVCELWFEVL